MLIIRVDKFGSGYKKISEDFRRNFLAEVESKEYTESICIKVISKIKDHMMTGSEKVV